jgi:diacylglycerol kinase
MPEIKAIKDISASGVFILTIISVVIGLIIFLPKVIYTFLSL